MNDPTSAPTPVDSVDLQVGEQHFTMYVIPDPSGLRGQVFDGEEKIAGVQIFHTTDVQLLVAMAQHDRAVLRAVERRASAAEQPC